MITTNFDSPKFFCMNCGKEGIPIPRTQGYKRGKMHRKVLYCPWCKETLNHVECHTLEEELKFKEDFNEGVYQDEAAESLSHVRSAGCRQKHLVS